MASRSLIQQGGARVPSQPFNPLDSSFSRGPGSLAISIYTLTSEPGLMKRVSFEWPHEVELVTDNKALQGLGSLT